MLIIHHCHCLFSSLCSSKRFQFVHIIRLMYCTYSTNSAYIKRSKTLHAMPPKTGACLNVKCSQWDTLQFSSNKSQWYINYYKQNSECNHISLAVNLYFYIYIYFYCCIKSSHTNWFWISDMIHLSRKIILVKLNMGYGTRCFH